MSLLKLSHGSPSTLTGMQGMQPANLLATVEVAGMWGPCIHKLWVTKGITICMALEYSFWA